MSGLLCWLALVGLLFAVLFACTVARVQRWQGSRVLRAEWRSVPWLRAATQRDVPLTRRAISRIKDFVYASTVDRTERIFAWWSFGFAIVSLGCAAVAFVVSGTATTKATYNQQVCIYIASAFMEIIGILTTVEGLIHRFDGTAGPPEGWAKIRGPAFIIAGIALGFVGNVQSISVP